MKTDHSADIVLSRTVDGDEPFLSNNYFYDVRAIRNFILSFQLLRAWAFRREFVCESTAQPQRNSRSEKSNRCVIVQASFEPSKVSKQVRKPTATIE